MAKRRDDDTAPTASANAKQAKASIAGAIKPFDDPSRIDRFVEIIDHCAAAKEAADALGEKFLSYLLAMAIQESRATVRRNSTQDKSAH